MAINATVIENRPIPASPSGAVYIKGDPGPPGPQGPVGPAGEDGQDGYSPTITSVPITDGHRLTIIDVDGVKTVDVMDGEDGQAGTTAGFGTPTATVDSGTGTPSVSVTASGPDTAKVFSFAFTNLKGEAGPNGPAGQMGPPGLEVSDTTPVSDVLAWIDTDEDTEILVPEMHTTGTPNVLDMGSEYLDAAAVYDRTQGKTQAAINAEREIFETDFSGTTDSNGNIYSYVLNPTDHVVLETTASGNYMCTPALNGDGSYWNYHISSYTNWNVGSGHSVTVYVRYMNK